MQTEADWVAQSLEITKRGPTETELLQASYEGVLAWARWAYDEMKATGDPRFDYILSACRTDISRTGESDANCCATGGQCQNECECCTAAA